ncbi:hypothetical protein RJ639_034478 [Escallonia herrerae]|uniref:Uncharacterized protein n=1 Tax=Escallonia herrerae TaxID=1293975 RepID=A0AA89BJQ6_9ASTE|nr:hypothetical protein RJ639_034478 [Escallonia herrerae]
MNINSELRKTDLKRMKQSIDFLPPGSSNMDAELYIFDNIQLKQILVSHPPNPPVESMQDISKWVLDIGDGKLSTFTLQDEDEPY